MKAKALLFSVFMPAKRNSGRMVKGATSAQISVLRLLRLQSDFGEAVAYLLST